MAATKVVALQPRSVRPPDPSTPAPNGTNHLLRLPVELRLHIYDFFLAGFDLKPPFSNDKRRKHNPPLMHTCKLFRHELLQPYLDRLQCIHADCHRGLKDIKKEFQRKKTSVFEILTSGAIPREDLTEKSRQLRIEEREMVRNIDIVCWFVEDEMESIVGELEEGLQVAKRF